MTSVRAIAKELHERGHYLDELYQITIAYATSLHVRYCAVDAKCEAIEDYYKTELDLSKYSWEEDELDILFNTVIGFEHNCNPFKK